MSTCLTTAPPADMLRHNWSHRFRLSTFALAAILGSFGICAGNADAQILGGNFNERSRDVDAQMLNNSQTSWVRGFFDVFSMRNISNLSSNSDITGMRRAADDGQQLLITLKWNFKSNEPVPAPGSAEEQSLFARAVQTLQAIGRPVNTIVLGNEPMIETSNSDLAFTSGASPYIPYVTFTERLRDYLDTNYGSTLATKPRYFEGSLNRLDLSSNQSLPVVQELFRVARDNPGIAGMDLHIHYDAFPEAQGMLQFGRQQLGASKDLVVTEFSPAYLYKAHLNDAIGATSAGVQFAQQYGYAPSLQVDDYLTAAFAHQVSRQEWTDFINSQPWYDVHHVANMRSLFQQYSVSIATMGFAQSTSVRGTDATNPNYTPFNLNWLYITGLVSGPAIDAYNEPYMQDWLKAQYQVADVNLDGKIDLKDYLRMVQDSSTDLSTLSNTAALTLGDLNLDRHIDAADFARFATLYQGANGVPFDVVGPADIDGNGIIDGHDWVLLLAHLGQNLASSGVDSGVWRSMGDIDHSGVVDRADFRLFKSAYAAINGAASLSTLEMPANLPVPEPSTLSLLGALLPVVVAISANWRRSSRESWMLPARKSARRSAPGLLAARPLVSFAFVLLSMGGASSPVCADAPNLILGANFNEHWQAARVPTLAAAHVRWIRGFLPATEFIDGPRNLAADEGVQTFQTAANSGYKIVLTLKWDFRTSHSGVPSPNSEREQKCFAWAVEAAKTCQPDVLCLVNETFIDTPDAAVQPDPHGDIPFVQFLERLAQHVKSADLRTRDGLPLPTSCGGFTKLYEPGMQSHPATLALLHWLSETDTVDLVNFHIHHSKMEEMESSLRYARRFIADKPFVITEFSRVWAYGTHRDAAIGADPQGLEFAGKYHLDPKMTVNDYLNSCYKQPVSEAQYRDFLASQTWFEPKYLDQACETMDRYGVALATYAFVQEASGGRRPLSKKSQLWCLNPIFADLMTVSSDPTRPGVSADFFDTFVARQERSAQSLRVNVR